MSLIRKSDKFEDGFILDSDLDIPSRDLLKLALEKNIDAITAEFIKNRLEEVPVIIRGQRETISFMQIDYIFGKFIFGFSGELNRRPYDIISFTQRARVFHKEFLENNFEAFNVNTFHLGDWTIVHTFDIVWRISHKISD